MVKVKICGIQRLQEIKFINQLKPDYVGFVFCESKRKVRPEQVEQMLSYLSPRITPVAVFRNNSQEEIHSMINNLDINWIQLHGEESQTLINSLHQKYHYTIIKTYQANIQSDYYIFDGKNPGSGEENNWDKLRLIPERSFVAGGLNIENIRKVIQKLKPFAVDVSSGVETNLLKDERKIEAFMKEVIYATR